MDKQELLNETEALAHGLMSRKEISIILDFDEGFFADDPELEMAFQKGWLKSKAEINKSIQALAASGSGPAQLQALEILNATKRNKNE